MRLAVGRGEGRGSSAREERYGKGQEVVTSWRTVEKAIMRSHLPRYDQRAAGRGCGLEDKGKELRGMREGGEVNARAKGNRSNRLTLCTKRSGGGMLWGGQGSERRGWGVILGGIYMSICRRQCMDVQGTLTMNEHGWAELGCLGAK